MRIEYEAIFQIDLGDAVPEVGELMNRLNSHLSTAGYDEKLQLKADIFSMSLSVSRELNEKEIHRMKTLLSSEVMNRLPQYDIRLKSFGRKSGNVQQSAE